MILLTEEEVLHELEAADHIDDAISGIKRIIEGRKANGIKPPLCDVGYNRYKLLRDQVIWACTHYGLVNTDGIINHLRETVEIIDAEFA